MRKPRFKGIPFIAPTGKGVVPLTSRERAQIPTQLVLAKREQARLAPFLRLEFSAQQVTALRAAGLSEQQILAAGTPRDVEEPSGGDEDIEPSGGDEDIEREAIQSEYEESYLEYDMPDWDDEFFDEWGDEIDYEIFTVLS